MSGGTGGREGPSAGRWGVAQPRVVRPRAGEHDQPQDGLAHVLKLRQRGSAPPPAAPVQHRRERRDRGLLSIAALALLFVCVAGVFAWRATGGTMLVMETPSMCPKVCVGALVADKPLTGPLHPGELITFHPPGDPTQTYTHEVYRLLPGGAVQTHGVAELGHDPWTITRAFIVGKPVFTIPAAGWLLKVLPVLGVGALSWVAVRWKVSPSARRSFDRVWLTMLAVIPLWTLHPLVNGQVVSNVGAGAYRQRVVVVNTGLLPASFHGRHGPLAAGVAPGHLASFTVKWSRHVPPFVHESASLPGWGWVLMALAVSAPLLGFAWHLLRGTESTTGTQGA